METDIDKTYQAVKNLRPDLYAKAVRIGHLALPEFIQGEPGRRAAAVEKAVICLIAEEIGVEL